MIPGNRINGPGNHSITLPTIPQATCANDARLFVVHDPLRQLPVLRIRQTFAETYFGQSEAISELLGHFPRLTPPVFPVPVVALAFILNLTPHMPHGMGDQTIDDGIDLFGFITHTHLPRNTFRVPQYACTRTSNIKGKDVKNYRVQHCESNVRIMTARRQPTQDAKALRPVVIATPGQGCAGSLRESACGGRQTGAERSPEQPGGARPARAAAPVLIRNISTGKSSLQSTCHRESGPWMARRCRTEAGCRECGNPGEHDATWENEIDATIDETIGVSGASDYLRTKLAEQRLDRQKRDAQRSINPLEQLRYNEATRSVLDTALGLVSGEIAGRATGLPLENPLFTILPGSVSDLTSITDGLEGIRTGEIKPEDFQSQYGMTIAEKIDQQKQKLAALETWTTGDATGAFTSGIGGIVAPVGQSLNTLFMGDRSMSESEGMFRQLAANVLKQTTSIQPAFLEGAIAEGKDWGEAAEDAIYENLLQQHNLLELDRKMQQYGMPGFESKLRETMADWEKQNDANKAAEWKPEDVFFAPYVFRNAKYDATSAALLQAGELAAGVAVASTGVGAPLFAAYMMAKQAYLGSLEGGTAGAVAGLASGGANALLSLNPATAGFNVNLSYTFEDGFGANIGYGKQIEEGVNVGGSVSLQEGKGITGFGVNARFTEKQEKLSYGGSFGMNWDIDGNFTGGNVKATGGYEMDAMHDINAGAVLNFDARGGVTSALLESSIDAKFTGKYFDNFDNMAYNGGVGLTFHRGGRTDVGVTQGVGFSREGAGVVGLDTSMTNTHSFNPDNSWDTTQQSVTVTGKAKTQTQFLAEYAGLHRALSEALLEGDAKKAAEIEARIQKMKPYADTADKEAAKERDNKKLLGLLGTDDAKRMQAILDDNKGELTNAQRKEFTLLAGIQNGGSDPGFLGTLANYYNNAVAWMAGRYSGSDGYIDSEGNWHQNTCFVKGTKVLVKDDRGVTRMVEITELKPSYRPYACDQHTGRDCDFYPITHFFELEAEGYYEVKYDDALTVGVTGDHPFNVAGSSRPNWQNVTALKPGMRQHTTASLLDGRKSGSGLLRMASYESIPIRTNHPLLSKRESPARIKSIRYIPGKVKVFNFTVGGAHTYFVGNERLAVHVHNAEEDAYWNRADKALDRVAAIGRYDEQQGALAETRKAKLQGRAGQSQERKKALQIIESRRGDSEDEIAERVQGKVESHHDVKWYHPSKYIDWFRSLAGEPKDFDTAYENLKSGSGRARKQAIEFFYKDGQYNASLNEEQLARFRLHANYAELGDEFVMSEDMAKWVIKQDLYPDSRDFALKEMREKKQPLTITHFERESMRWDLIHNETGKGKLVDSLKIIKGSGNPKAEQSYAYVDPGFFNIGTATIVDDGMYELGGFLGDDDKFMARAQYLAHEVFHVYQYSRDGIFHPEMSKKGKERQAVVEKEFTKLFTDPEDPQYLVDHAEASLINAKEKVTTRKVIQYLKRYLDLKKIYPARPTGEEKDLFDEPIGIGQEWTTEGAANFYMEKYARRWEP